MTNLIFLVTSNFISSSLVSEPAEGPGPDHKPTHERPTIPEVSSSAHLATADDQVYEKKCPSSELFYLFPCKLHVEF